jgi:hypothetical protein
MYYTPPAIIDPSLGTGACVADAVDAVLSNPPEAGPRTIRCSSLDSLFACPQSVLADGAVNIDTAGEAAEIGAAVHTLLATHIATRGLGCDVAGECARRGIADAEEEVGQLVLAGQRAWDELKQYFPQPKPEQFVSCQVTDKYTLAGTCDVLSAAGKGAIFADWKTGRVDEGYHQQMFGYAYCCWNMLGRPEAEIAGVVVFLRHRYHRIVKYTPARLREWEADLVRNVLSTPHSYSPGNQCAQCKVYAGCEARRQIVAGTLHAMMDPPEPTAQAAHRAFLATANQLLSGLTVENKSDPAVARALSELRFRLKLAGQAIENADSMIRQAVQRVGPIPLENNTELALRDYEQKSLDPLKSLRVIRPHLSDADIAGAMKLSLPKLRDAVGSKHKRGEKKAAIALMEQELDAAGAIETTTRQRLEVVDTSDAAQAK